MTGDAQGNAMTEIALAMAMGFFSVMILATLSMGIGDGRSVRIATAALADGVAAASGNAAEKLRDDDVLVIFDGKGFFGRTLQSLDPAGIDSTRRVVLAVDPNLPMQQAMAARSRFEGRSIVVTTLTPDWRRALRERRRGR